MNYKHFLRRWGYYDTNINDLTAFEKYKMRLLYAALMKLEPEERQLLADKYYKFSEKMVTDNELAYQYNTTVAEYKAVMNECEAKFHEALKQAETSQWYTLSHADGLKIMDRTIKNLTLSKQYNRDDLKAIIGETLNQVVKNESGE